MNKCYCFNRRDFNEFCKDWTSDFYPSLSAFISICNTNDDSGFVSVDELTHHFKRETSEIINLDFDDITEPRLVCEGHVCIGMSEDDAFRLAKFIDRNIGKDFYIHCEGGLSRSQGVVRYILDVYGEKNFETRRENPCKIPNLYVTALLKRAYMKLKNIEFV